MQCPACNRGLTERTVGGITVDICQSGCSGIWFDWLELKKFDEPHEEAGTELLDLERNPAVSIDRSKRLSCPKCDETIGLVLFEMLTGRPAFADSSVLRVLTSVRTVEPERLATKVDDAFRPLLQRMLKRQPETRTITMREVETTLSALSLG